MTRAVARRDGRGEPAYSIAEAARYLKLPHATLRSWIAGRHYPRAGGRERFQPLIEPAQSAPPLLSFWNLIEAHVLRSLRTEHGVAIREVRRAIAFAERELGLPNLLLREELRTYAGQVFVERYGALINLSASGQLAMRKLLADHLERVQWRDDPFPERLYPFVAGQSLGDRSIAIDPAIALGRPVVLRAGISTAVIVERLDAGEKPAEIAADYELHAGEVEVAVLYERAA